MRIIARLLLLLILLASTVATVLYSQYQQFLQSPLSFEQAKISYTVTSGGTVTRLANDLLKQGIFKSEQELYFFRFMAKLKQKTAIKVGVYELTSGLLPEQLLDRLISGQTKQYQLTLIEGWNFFQVLSAIRSHPQIKPVLNHQDWTEIMSKLGHAHQHPEGRFYPDTYYFPAGTTDLEFLQRAYQTMQGILTSIWRQRQPNLPLKSKDDMLILASIIEKETGLASERQQIAGVFIRRLQGHMKLQTDPTVIYGIGARFDGNLTRKHLRQDTPYNTYVHYGLPPTAIAMPGRDSLWAAVNPDKGDSLYFVANGSGGHYFSKTLTQHNQAVRKYQLKQ